MRRLLLSVLIVSFFLGGLQAQRGGGLVDKNDESQSYLSLSLGPEYCLSDEQTPLLHQLSFNDNDFTLGYRTTFANNLGYKFAFSYSDFTGNDNWAKIIERRYSYSSSVLQLALQGEYFIKIGRQYYYKPTPNAIYFFVGAGFLRVDANLNTNNDIRGNYIYKPISYAPVIPFGFGYQYNFNNNFLLGAEFNGRFPFSDYIDGFKPPTLLLQNGIKTVSKSNDVMGGFSITFTYLLGFNYLRRY
jgi:hypothetical protein